MPISDSGLRSATDPTRLPSGSARTRRVLLPNDGQPPSLDLNAYVDYGPDPQHATDGHQPPTWQNPG